jgi:hypothetical protein
VHDPAGDPLAGGVPAPDQLLRPGPGGMVLGTGGNDFYPSVTLQLWGDAPPRQPGTWEAVEESEMWLPTGRLQVGSVTAGSAGPVLVAGPPGRFGIRAHCRGRSQARARIGVELYYHGLEQWLLQVWPLDIDEPEVPCAPAAEPEFAPGDFSYDAIWARTVRRRGSLPPG